MFIISHNFWEPGTPKASQVALMVKNLPANANAGALRDTCSMPGWGRSPGEGNGNPLQCSCLENAMDRGAWQATVHRVTKSWTRLKWLSTRPDQGRGFAFKLTCVIADGPQMCSGCWPEASVPCPVGLPIGLPVTWHLAATRASDTKRGRARDTKRGRAREWASPRREATIL